MAIESNQVVHPNPAQEEDEAMRAFSGEQGGVEDLDEETNTRLLRIIDRNLLPVGNSTFVGTLSQWRLLILVPNDSCYVLFMG
jgi:hypothetical protein